MNPKIKLAFFDMEGTIYKRHYKDSIGNTSPSQWTKIAELLGPKAYNEEEATKVKWNNNHYTGYVEWMEKTIEIHQKYNLKKDTFDKVMNMAEYFNGVKETFNILQKNKIITVLISGGFKANADRAQIDLGINHSFAACEYFWDKKGNLIHWNLLPCDYEGKEEFMHSMMREYQLDKEECAFIGDGINDLYLAKQVGLSIAWNAHPQLQEICTYKINQSKGKEDFKDILQYLIK